MSAWLLSEIEKAGGVDTSPPDGDRGGEFRATYRGFYLLFSWDEMRVARQDGFDRWANSTMHSGPVPTTLASLDEVLGGLALTSAEG